MSSFSFGHLFRFRSIDEQLASFEEIVNFFVEMIIQRSDVFFVQSKGIRFESRQVLHSSLLVLLQVTECIARKIFYGYLIFVLLDVLHAIGPVEERISLFHLDRHLSGVDYVL